MRLERGEDLHCFWTCVPGYVCACLVLRCRHLIELKGVLYGAAEVFASFWVNIENVDFNKNILAYLLTAAKNKSLNILSRESYKNKYRSDVINDYYQTINQKLLKDNVTSNIFGKEIEVILQKAFEQMPQYVKETFVMCKLKGFKQREVAIILGISEKTVEQRMKRAMMVIRREFKDYLPFLFLFFKIGLYIYK